MKIKKKTVYIVGGIAVAGILLYKYAQYKRIFGLAGLTRNQERQAYLTRYNNISKSMANQPINMNRW